MGLLDRLSGLLGTGDAPDPEELFESVDADGTGAASGGEADGEDAVDEGAAGDSADAGDEPAQAGGHAGAAESTGPAAAAREFADQWREHDLDFTPASLARLDDLVDRQWDPARFRDAELGGAGMDDRVFTGLVHRLGSYYGEVLVRHLDGEWVEHDQLGTAVAVDGAGEAAAVSNAYHIAADCLTEPSKFALSFDTVVDQVGRDRDRVSEGGHVVTAEADGLDDEGGDADGAGGDPDAGESLDPDEVAARFDEDAADLVEAFPGYDLDYSPASLARLDRLVAEEFAGHDFSGVPLGREDDGDSLFLTARAMEGGGYIAAVLRRAIGGAWRDDEDGLGFVVEGERGTARLDPVAVAADVYRGEDSFAATYDALVEKVSADAERAGDGEAAAEGEAAADGEADAGHEAAAEPPRDAAASFAADYPAYDLDFSPASLERVDALASDLSGAPDDVGRGMAAYVGETFVRAHGATWTREDGAWVVEVAGDAEEPVVVALRPLVEDAVAGEAAVADVHGHVADRLGLDGPTEADGTGAATEEPAGEAADGDAVIDRFAARAAVEAAAEDEREAAPEAAIERHRAAAEDLAADWPDYDLDFSVESLVRLDALVAASFDESGGDREYDGDPLAVPEGAKLSIPTDGSVEAFAGYLAELFRRYHDATWRADGDDLVLVVEGPAGTTAFDPQLVAIACFAGESSFVDAYARVAADAGLEPPI